jgi:hypothetical protein
MSTLHVNLPTAALCAALEQGASWQCVAVWSGVAPGTAVSPACHGSRMAILRKQRRAAP